MESDRIYYRRRLADEIEAAAVARSSAARACHRRLALLYSRKLQALGIRRTQLALVDLDQAA